MRRVLGFRSSSDAPGFGVPVHGTRHAIGSKLEQFYHVLATCWASFMLAGTPYRATDHDLLLGRPWDRMCSLLCVCVCASVHAYVAHWRRCDALVLHVCLSVEMTEGDCTCHVGIGSAACRCQRRGQAFAGGDSKSGPAACHRGVGESGVLHAAASEGARHSHGGDSKSGAAACHRELG